MTHSLNELVFSIEKKERKTLLSKFLLNGFQEKKNPLNQNHKIKKEKRIPSDNENTMSMLKKEPFFYQMLIKLLSLVFRTSTERVYNGSLIKQLKKQFQAEYPDIIDCKQEILLLRFHDMIISLEEARQQIQHYINSKTKFNGKLYVYLAEAVIPDFMAQLKKEEEPYFNGKMKLSEENKILLLKKRQKIISNLTSEDNSKVMNAIRNIVWLKDFSELILRYFNMQFSSAWNGIYGCPFVSARMEFQQLETLMEKVPFFSEDTFKAIYKFLLSSPSQNEYLQRTSEKLFCANMASYLHSIKTISECLSYRQLGCIIYNDFNREPDKKEVKYNWFSDFYDELQNSFNKNWEKAIQDVRKRDLLQSISENFLITEIPQLPYRPWTNVHGEVTFRLEQTAGFLFWYASERYKPIEESLNHIVLKLVFNDREKRMTFSNAINTFSLEFKKILSWSESFSPDGDKGKLYKKFASVTGRLFYTIKPHIESEILKTESEIHKATQRIIKASQDMSVTLSTLESHKNTKKDSKTLASKNENSQLHEIIIDVRKKLIVVEQVLKEIEKLDLEKKS